MGRVEVNRIWIIVLIVSGVGEWLVLSVSLRDILDEIIFDDCLEYVLQMLNLCLGPIIVVFVTLVVRIWENFWESGSLEVKCRNCISAFDKKVGDIERWSLGWENVCVI